MRSGHSCGAKDCDSKKTLFALEQGRADVARRRRRWRSWQASLDPQRLVFIDETWIKTSMAPLRGWGPKGERVRGFAPHGHWRTLTFLGALRCNVSRPLASSTGRSTASASELMSNSNSFPFSSPATSSSWTISAAISRPLCAASSAARRQALVPAALLTRSQSDRAGLCQDQALDAHRPEAHHRRHLALHRRPRHNYPAPRMQQLFRQRRLRFRQIVKRSSGRYCCSIVLFSAYQPAANCPSRQSAAAGPLAISGNQKYSHARSAPTQGAYASSRTWSGMRWTRRR